MNFFILISYVVWTPSPMITSYTTRSLRKKMQLNILASLYTIRCLGIICSIVKKANSPVGFLRQNLQIHQKHIKANAYKTLVWPQIKYASTMRDPFTQENQNKSEMVQRRATCFVCNNYRCEASVTTMLDKLGWCSLKQRRADQRLIILYKIVNNLVEVDQLIIPQLIFFFILITYVVDTVLIF